MIWISGLCATGLGYRETDFGIWLSETGHLMRLENPSLTFGIRLEKAKNTVANRNRRTRVHGSIAAEGGYL
jgi:hypothetical protein